MIGGSRCRGCYRRARVRAATGVANRAASGVWCQEEAADGEAPEVDDALDAVVLEVDLVDDSVLDELSDEEVPVLDEASGDELLVVDPLVDVDFLPRLSVLKNPEPLKVTPTGVNTFLTAMTSPDWGWAISVSVSSWKACWTSIVSPESTNL